MTYNQLYAEYMDQFGFNTSQTILKEIDERCDADDVDMILEIVARRYELEPVATATNDEDYSAALRAQLGTGKIKPEDELNMVEELIEWAAHKCAEATLDRDVDNRDR